MTDGESSGIGPEVPGPDPSIAPFGPYSIPARALSPHPDNTELYRTVFVIAFRGQERPQWREMAEALDFLLEQDAVADHTAIAYWGEVEVPAALSGVDAVDEWLVRHPEAWSIEAYGGYLAGMRAAARQWEERAQRLRLELAGKLVDLADAIYPTQSEEPEPPDFDSWGPRRHSEDDIPF